ncbi:MAG: T9SS type A sorting domain-containing protein, partial [Chitinophagales bacterium]
NYNTSLDAFVNYQQTFYYYTDFLSGVSLVEKINFDCLLYPNPGGNSIQLKILNGDNEKICVKLFDESGDLLKTQIFSVMRGPNSVALDVTSLSSGEYLILIVDVRNSILGSKEFIKQ